MDGLVNRRVGESLRSLAPRLSSGGGGVFEPAPQVALGLLFVSIRRSLPLPLHSTCLESGPSREDSGGADAHETSFAVAQFSDHIAAISQPKFTSNSTVVLPHITTFHPLTTLSHRRFIFIHQFSSCRSSSRP
ncbi:hypothetical protein BDD12DRAFT_11104 [Trichophaea hybrida]|nr:hypothetical protein BDD12DRAFT_11104 [Trichophaea hybrida]